MRTALEVPLYLEATGNLKATESLESLDPFVTLIRVCGFFKVCSVASMSIAMII